MYLSNDPNAPIILQTWLAFSRIDRSFCSDSNVVAAISGDVIFLFVNSDIAIGSKSMKTSLNSCLLERMSFQDSSARAPDKLNNSKSLLSSWTGTPHSSSWKAM
jgi:hypothetical protein